jgi:hypothetical protein
MSILSIQNAIAPLRSQLLQHPLYSVLEDESSLRTFMEFHVFAVWDFMSLVKHLQRELCCVSLPWVPPKDSHSARLINEIVLAEETDFGPDGQVMSHFEIYRLAMHQFEASTLAIDDLLQKIESANENWKKSLESLHPGISDFVLHTFREISEGNISRIAAAFTFGREDLLPDVFSRIVERLATESPHRLQMFQYYLARHIELDGSSHKVLAEQLVARLCGVDPLKWEQAQEAAVQALRARLQLWDAIYAQCSRSGFRQKSFSQAKSGII